MQSSLSLNRLNPELEPCSWGLRARLLIAGLKIHKACRDLSCLSPRLHLHVTWCSHKKGLTVTAILFLPENELKPLAIPYPINSSFSTISAATQVLKFKSLQRPNTLLQRPPVLLPHAPVRPRNETHKTMRGHDCKQKSALPATVC